MMINFKPLWLTLALLFTTIVSVPSWALNVTASVSKTNISKDEVIQLKIVADEKLDGNKVSFDTLSNDFYVGRPSFSSSVNILNGTRTDSSVWTVAIAPQRLGKLVIPSFDVNGIATTPITLNVTMDEQTPTTADMVEVRTQLSKSELYPKESAILDTRIIVKVDPRMLQNPNLKKPEGSGLQISPVSEPKQYQAVLDGVEVLIIDQSFRVIAEQSGEFAIQAPTLTGGVLYGNTRTGGTKILTLDSESPKVNITVLPIPDNYNGIWLPTSNLTLNQDWQLDGGQKVDSPTVKITTGDSLTRTVTLTASGVTSEQLPDLTLAHPEGFRVYNEKPTFRDNGDSSVTMTTKQVLIAKRSGEFVIPDLSVQWWDSLNKKSTRSQVEGMSVVVNASDETVAANFSTANPNVSDPVVVNDAGYWPWVSALFACLWIGSCYMWYRAANKPSLTIKASPSDGKDSSSIQTQLINAINQGDSIKAHAMLPLWLSDVELTHSDITAIRHEFNSMSRALDGNSDDQWNSTTLLGLISAAQKSKRSAPSPLAPL